MIIYLLSFEKRTGDLKMWRLLWVMPIILSLLVIGACSDKNKVTEPSEESPGDMYGFTSFDLNVNTKEMKEAIKVNFDEKRDKTEAFYENKIDGLYLHGDKAMEKLDSLFEDLSLEPIWMMRI